MLSTSPARWLALLSAMAALGAVAQTVPAAGESPPPKPPALSFRSAFEGYQPYADGKPIPWKSANETVHQRGGWRAYANEASGQGAAEGGATPAAADPHAGHAMPKPEKKEQP